MLCEKGGRRNMYLHWDLPMHTNTSEYYTARDHPEGLHSEQANGTAVETEVTSLCFLNHLHAVPRQNFTETRTKQNKQKPLGFSLFLWESVFLGTPSGELIVNLITHGLGFPWKGCFSRKERDSPHPNGTHTSPDAPLLPFHPLLLSFYVTQPFFLKVPLVFFKESTPNKNLCRFPPKPSRLKTKQNNKALILGLKWGIGKSWFPPSTLHPHPQTMETKRNKTQSEQKQQQGKHVKIRTLHVLCSPQIRRPGEKFCWKIQFSKKWHVLVTKTPQSFSEQRSQTYLLVSLAFSLSFSCFPESWMMLEKKKRTRQKIMLG